MIPVHRHPVHVDVTVDVIVDVDIDVDKDVDVDVDVNVDVHVDVDVAVDVDVDLPFHNAPPFCLSLWGPPVLREEHLSTCSGGLVFGGPPVREEKYFTH